MLINVYNKMFENNARTLLKRKGNNFLTRVFFHQLRIELCSPYRRIFFQRKSLIGIVRSKIPIKAIHFSHQSPFKNYFPLFVFLLIFCRKFVDPTQFCIAFLAIHIPKKRRGFLPKLHGLLYICIYTPYDVPTSQHDPILSLTAK